MRVRYFEGQRLRAEDLRAEQEYLIALERRHNLTQHGPGIVRGLDLGTDWTGAPIIRAGVAVDEEGRVLVLERASPVDEVQDAWLIPCETPFRIGRPGHTSCDHDRLRERVRVVTGEPVAPLEGAVSLTAPAYTFLSSAEVRDPAGRAWMHAGPPTGRDRQGFIVSTTDAAGVLAPRIALDRLGTNALLGTTTVAGYRASAAIALSQHETLFVQARRPGPQGERIRVHIQPEGELLRVQFFDGPVKSDRELILPEEGRAEAAKNFQSDLVTTRITQRFSFPSRLINIFAIRRPPVIAEAVEREAQVQPPQETPLKARASTVSLADWPKAEQKQQKQRVIGCIERLPEETDLGRGPNGLSFLPMATLPKAPPVPGMGSVKGGTVEVPRELLLLDLGEKRDGDASVRFTLGHRDDTGQYFDWMRVRGTSIVSVTDLHVTGQIRVAPLAADHTDINFATLLVRAFLDGLEAAIDASTNIVVSFSDLPAIIKTDEDWTYKVMITNTSGAPITVGRLLETLTLEGDPAPLSDSHNINAPIGGGTHLLKEITHSAGQLQPGLLTIAVRTSGKRGDAPWRASFELPDDQMIPIVASPTIELDGIPASVPANQGWTQSFVVRNNAGVPVTLTGVTMQEDANPAQAVVIADPNVPANGSVVFGPTPHNGIANDLDVVVAATIQWSDNTITPIERAKTISVRNDLGLYASPVVAPSLNAPWRYDLTIDNRTQRDIRIVAMRQSIAAAFANPAPPAEGIVIPPDVIVPANEAVLFEDVDGIVVPEQVNEIDLTIVVDYAREDLRAFTFTGERKGIDVV